MRWRLLQVGGPLLLTSCAVLSGLDQLASGDGSARRDPRSADLGSSAPPGHEANGGSLPGSSGGEGGPSGPSQPNDAPQGGFCANVTPAPTLCTDFDDGVFPGEWLLETDGSAKASLDTMASSPSNSILFTVSKGGYAFLRKDFPQPSSQLHLGFTVRLSQLSLGGLEFEFAVIRLGSSGYELQLERVDGSLNLEEEVPGAGGSFNTPLGVPFADDEWRRIDLDISMSTRESSITITAEGAAPVTKPLSAHRYNGPATIQVGYDNPADSIANRFDDIVVDIQ